MKFSYRPYLIYVILIAGVCFNDISGQAQNINFKTISMSDGLSNNSVNAVLEDSKGFIWIATSDGLNRWDGYRFKTFKYDAENENSLPNNYILCLEEDQIQNLWIGTSHYGLARYDLVKERFHKYRTNDTIPTSISGDFIRCVFTDSKGGTWIGSHSGLSKYIPEEDHFRRISFPVEQIDKPLDIQDIFQLTESELIIQTTYGLFILDLESEEVSGTDLGIPVSHPEILGQGFAMCFDSDQNIWLGSASGLIKYNILSGQVSYYLHDDRDPSSISSQIYSNIFEDSNHNIWIGTENNGLNFYNKDDDNFIVYRENEITTNSLPDNTIINIYEDSNSNIWISTEEGGVSYFSSSIQPIEYFAYNPLDINSIVDPKVACFFEDEDKSIWIGGGDGGLNHLDRETGKIKKYKLESDIISPTILSVRQSMSNKDELFLGGWGFGISSFDRKTGLFVDLMEDIPDAKIEKYRKNIKGMGADSEGKLWLASHYASGLVICDPEKKAFYDVDDPGPYHPDLVGIPYAVTMLEDSKKRIWIPTYTGLYMFDSSMHYFHSEQGENNTLSSDYIFDLYEDSRQNIWIGSTHGLDRLVQNGNSYEFERYSKIYGLPDNVKGILEDSTGNLWLSSNMGITAFNKETKSIQHYLVNKELPVKNFIERSKLRTSDGEMYFGSTNGFLRFHPDTLSNNLPEMKIHITDLQIFNQSQSVNGKVSPLNKSILETDEIELNYNQNVLGFEYTALNFNHIAPVEYAYTMEGFDRDWYRVGEKSFVSYTNLSPGDYVFRVKITDGNQLSSNEASLRIHINPPFWRTKLAIVFYVVLGIVLLILFRRSILYRSNLQNELRIEKMTIKNVRETNLMKLRFFTNISHEFRTPLTLIKAPLDKLQTKGHELNREDRKYYLNLIQNSTNRLLHMVNQLMDYRKMEAGSLFLEPSMGDIIEFIQKICNQFQEISKQKKINLFFKSELDSQMMIFDADKIEKIISNLLSNAIKYTDRGGKITLSINKKSGNEKGELIIIRVKDNGVGIPSDHLPHIFDRFYSVAKKGKNKLEGTGIGLTLVKELSELHKGRVSVNSVEGEGAEFIIRLPIVQDEQLLKAEEKKATIKYSDKEKHFKGIIDSKIDGKKDGGRKKVLIVEDDPDLRTFLDKELSIDFLCITAKDGEEGLRMAFFDQPDIIISDIMMPNIDGLELCRSIKSDERTSHLPVILLTARYSQEKHLEGLELGADDYIFKPFNIEILKSKILNLLSNRQDLIDKFRTSTSLYFEDQNQDDTNKKLIQSIIDIILENITNEKLNADFIAKKVLISRSLVYLKIESLTGLTVNEFIRNIRLKKASRLLLQKNMNITEVAYAVGFSSQSYFTRSFTKLFNISPKAYIKNNGEIG